MGGRQQRRLAKLDAKRRRLVELALEGAVPGDLVREQQESIRRDMEDARRLMTQAGQAYGTLRGLIQASLGLVSTCHASYLSAPPSNRRQWNQAWFEYFEIPWDEVTEATPIGVVGVFLEPGLDRRLERDLEAIRETEPRSSF